LFRNWRLETRAMIKTRFEPSGNLRGLYLSNVR
jgi:hypothetical protein